MNIGILGAGKVAVKMMKTLQGMEGEDIHCVAVGARDLDRANAFAERHGVAQAHGSYQELVENPQVDVIYIATPHSHHYEQMKLCLAHGKHILCEKAFTVNAIQGEEILSMAKEKNLLVLEGMWTRFLPIATTLKKILADKKVGEAKSMHISICHNNIQNERVHQPSLAGGTLLNLTVYPLNFVDMFFGNQVKSLTGQATLSETGVDTQNAVQIVYENDFMVSIHASSLTLSAGEAMIYCEDGYISIPRAEKLQEILVYDTKHNLVESHESESLITGFEFQLRAMKKALEEGKLECEEMSHSDTLRILQQMDTLRRQWGLCYPCE